MMEPKDWINIAAIILGPIIAIQIQKWLESRREDRTKKYTLFSALMITRGSRLSPNHVFALNQIDLEFSSYVNIFGFRSKTKKYKKVLEAWKIYHDHLGNFTETPDWATKRDDLFTELLYLMGDSLGYDFDKVVLKRGSYMPQGWSDSDEMDVVIKKGMHDLMTGEKVLPVIMKSDPSGNPLAN
ncbi:DUF6680 family protein [Leptospira licerasiae]|uniref:DUF6680 family protein n=1 Tax=Leptospira licerasiae TaxID=447106 RepID=UPI003015917F